MSNSTSSTRSGKPALYQYDPSQAAAIIFIVLFFCTTAYHTFKLFQQRTWYFIPFLIGGIFEVLGFIFREWSASQTPNWTSVPFIYQTLFTLLAPTLFAASIYMVLGRIVRLTKGEKHSLVRVNWLTKIFVGGDILSFLVQGAGGGILASADSKSTQDSGSHLILGGLFIQLIFFGFFIVVTALFHRRIANNPTTTSTTLAVPWQRFLFVLYGASTFIMIRSIYRIVEYAEGNTGTLASNEWFFYVFDATLMFLTMVLFNFYHPSQIINHDTMSKGRYASRSGIPLDEHSEESMHMNDNSRSLGPRSMA